MLELILLFFPVCQPEYWIKVYRTYNNTDIGGKFHLLQNGVKNPGVNFTPKMEWFCIIYFYSFFELNLLCELQNQLR